MLPAHRFWGKYENIIKVETKLLHKDNVLFLKYVFKRKRSLRRKRMVSFYLAKSYFVFTLFECQHTLIVTQHVEHCVVTPATTGDQD